MRVFVSCRPINRDGSWDRWERESKRQITRRTCAVDPCFEVVLCSVNLESVDRGDNRTAKFGCGLCELSCERGEQGAGRGLEIMRGKAPRGEMSSVLDLMGKRNRIRNRNRELVP